MLVAACKFYKPHWLASVGGLMIRLFACCCCCRFAWPLAFVMGQMETTDWADMTWRRLKLD